MTGDSADDLSCEQCGVIVPPGAFCGACGAHLSDESARATHRRWAFAAHPEEHVFHPSAVSTLFPHLPHQRSSPFRFGLLASAILLVVLGYLRFTGPAIAAAAMCVPVLYLLYLYEVEVYEDEPVLVLAVTLLLGAILGAVWALLTSQFVTGTLLLNMAPQGASVGRVFVTTVLVPLGAALLMLAGAMVLYVSRRFDESLDGFAFGVAGALGFALGSTLVELSPDMQAGLTSSVPTIDNVLTIIERGLLLPFIYATTTGLIAGSLWLRHGKTRSLRAHGWTSTLGATAALAVVVQVALGFETVFITHQWLQVFIYAGVALFLLFAARVAIHHMLLAEAVKTTVGPMQPCSHCHRMVPRMSFCPHCGIATRATPKIGTGRLGREVR